MDIKRFYKITFDEKDSNRYVKQRTYCISTDDSDLRRIYNKFLEENKDCVKILSIEFIGWGGNL